MFFYEAGLLLLEKISFSNKFYFILFSLIDRKYQEIVKNQDNTGGLSNNFLVSLNILKRNRFEIINSTSLK